MANRAETVDQEQEALILDGIERFLDRDVRPTSPRSSTTTSTRDIVEKMKEMGLFGATISEDYGGLGLPVTTYAKIIERLSHAWMSVSGLINSHLIMAAAVERFGTDEQRDSTCPASPAASFEADWRSPSPTAARTCRRSRTTRSARATTPTSSTAPRPGSPTASTAPASRSWSRPTPTPSRATKA